MKESQTYYEKKLKHLSPKDLESVMVYSRLLAYEQILGVFKTFGTVSETINKARIEYSNDYESLKSKS